MDGAQFEHDVEVLSIELYSQFLHFDPTDARDWQELGELEREMYRSAINGLLLKSDLIKLLHS